MDNEINNISFYLEDCYEMHSLYPKTFSIPSRNDILRLREDDLVKLIFVFKIQREGFPSAERMWVKITNIDDYEIEENHDGAATKVSRRKFSGTLEDEPYFIQDIHYGDFLEFDDFNIATTELPYEPTINIDDLCLVSQEALDQKKSELAIRYLSPQFENDSGWRFYVGNEGEADIICSSDSKNLDEIQKFEKNSGMVTKVIREIIKTIPLLQNLIEEEEGIFQFSESDTGFVKLQSLL